MQKHAVGLLCKTALGKGWSIAGAEVSVQCRVILQGKWRWRVKVRIMTSVYASCLHSPQGGWRLHLLEATIFTFTWTSARGGSRFEGRGAQQSHGEDEASGQMPWVSLACNSISCVTGTQHTAAGETPPASSPSCARVDGERSSPWNNPSAQRGGGGQASYQGKSW